MRNIFLGCLLVVPFLACAESPRLPAKKELKALALESVLAFNAAIQAKDFAAFHQQISQLWQGQITPERLKEIFASFIAQEIDLSAVATVDATFDEPPKIDGDGILILQGDYPMPPGKVEFRLKYVFEKTSWKLFGIKVNVPPSGGGSGAVPSEEDAQTLALDSLLALNNGIAEKDFAQFYQHIAKAWQQETTAEKLQANFQSFIDKEADFAPIAKITPIFDAPPAINANDILELQGFYPTSPRQLRFNLGYLYEAPAWKLVKIKVNIDETEDEEETEN